MRVGLLLVGLFLALAGCGEPDDEFGLADGGSGGSAAGGSGGAGGLDGGGGTGGAGGSVVPGDPVRATCPDGRHECITFEVPIDWASAGGETIPFVVRRIASP